MLGLRRLCLRPVAAGTTILITTLIAACGSSDASAPAAAPTVEPTSAPVATPTPEPTATPEPEFVPGPREVEFVDGQFKVNFLYRSEPGLAAAIDVVDVESIIGPVLERIGPLIEGEKTTITFKTTTAGLNATNIAKLSQRGYVIVFDLVPGRIDFRINPNGTINMVDFWQVIVPFELASESYTKIRFLDENGSYGDALLDFLVMYGLGLAFQQEIFPDHEEQLRELRPEFAAVIYDLSPEGEHELWEAALPDLDILSADVVARFLDIYTGGTGEFPTGSGEAIGLRIVQAYMDKNSGVTASDLLRVSPEDILEGSNYSP